MRRTFLISAVTAIVVMAIAVFAMPRLGTAIAGPDSPEALAASNAATIAMVMEKAKRAAAFAAEYPQLFKSANVNAITAAVPEGSATPSGCCSPWQGFNITGTTVSRVTAGVPCINCVPGGSQNHVAIPFPEGNAFIGANWSTTVTWHSKISGPCTVFYGWWSLSLGRWIAGAPQNIANCAPDGENVWATWLTNITVPNAPGDTIAVSVIQSGAGPVDTDYMQFFIQ